MNINAKVPINISDANYMDKCNGKECYICGSAVPGYKKLMCGCGDTIRCPLCSSGKPANVPICDKKECHEKLQDKFTPIVKPKDS